MLSARWRNAPLANLPSAAERGDRQRLCAERGEIRISTTARQQDGEGASCDGACGHEERPNCHVQPGAAAPNNARIVPRADAAAELVERRARWPGGHQGADAVIKGRCESEDRVEASGQRQRHEHQTKMGCMRRPAPDLYAEVRWIASVTRRRVAMTSHPRRRWLCASRLTGSSSPGASSSTRRNTSHPPGSKTFDSHLPGRSSRGVSSRTSQDHSTRRRGGTSGGTRSWVVPTKPTTRPEGTSRVRIRPNIREPLG